MVDMPDPDDEKPAPQVPPDKPGDDPSDGDRSTAERDDDGERRASADKDHPDSF